MNRLAVLTAVSSVLAGGAVALAAPAAAAAHVLVVAPGGSDAAAGTAGAPLRTIQVAVERLPRGGVVELRGGVYHQRVVLHGVRHLTLRPYRHERAVLSGAGLAVPQGRSALIDVAGSRDVTVRGLDVTGYRTTDIDAMPIGVYVHGHDTRIRVIGNHVHDLGNDNGTLGSFDINAHGIAVYGTDPHAAITRLLIARNTVDNLHLGASESVVVNGNVDGWAIRGNRIHDNDNIGIDAIGFEPTLPGKYRYTQLNRARHGVIEGNTIARIRSQGNPAYWEDGEWCNCADGIYVDGGAYIRVSGNRVADNDIGIEVAAENPRGRADHVLVRRNVITGSLYTGIATGGYCNGADDCGGVQTGSSWHNTFEHNWLRGNNRLDDGSPEVLLQYHVHDAVLRHNTVIATNSDHVLYGTQPDADGSGTVSDHNRFRVVGGGPASAQFGWLGHVYTGFAAYRAATGQDARSTFG